MHHTTKWTLIIYGSWASLWTTLSTASPILGAAGEYGVSGHLWLTITGAPLSLLSWLAPHGTLSGVLAAGILGTLQWVACAELLARRQ